MPGQDKITEIPQCPVAIDRDVQTSRDKDMDPLSSWVKSVSARFATSWVPSIISAAQLIPPLASSA